MDIVTFDFARSILKKKKKEKKNSLSPITFVIFY